jgi:hypothetical protein
LWLAVWTVSVVAYGVIQVAEDWQAPSWVTVSIILLGLVSVAQCCRWHLHRHRTYIAAKLSARAAADHAKAHQR